MIETVDDTEGLLYIRTFYTALKDQVEADRFVDSEFALASPEDTVWSYNGGGEGPQSRYDTLQKIVLSDSAFFYRENRQDETAAGIPAADIYSRQGGITVGDASATRRQLSAPVSESQGSVKTSIRRPGDVITAETWTETGQSFVTVHRGDYYMGLRGYAEGMKKLGFTTLSREQIPESSYDLRWESWGWEFDWTIDLILNKLDELERLGVKQITLDDGWYRNSGEWALNEEKLPNGAADMRRLTDAIHERGMTAILWWRPCDGGREDSRVFREHPEYFVKNEDGSFGTLSGPGQWNDLAGSCGYALCPGSEGAVQSQVDFINRAMEEWGFDGFKSDYVWSLPNCYNPRHHHLYPRESTEGQSRFYRAVYEAMTVVNSDAFHLLCNCGTPQDFYSLPFVTQIPTADPTSVDQTRRRVKAYKALCGDYFPVTTDHNEVWYPSTIGTGAVMAEKRDLSGWQEAEYAKWLRIAMENELQSGEFVGDLYSYGYDPYETYVVNKEGVLYYAFYRDGKQYSPQGDPEIEIKGLEPGKRYRIVDYVNQMIVATNLTSENPAFTYPFDEYLLVKAVEIPGTDTEEPGPLPDIQGMVSVEEDSGAIHYEGSWSMEQNESFHGDGACYTKEPGASAEMTFTGTGVAWYGQNDVNFGTAEVYIDGKLDREVVCKGDARTQVKLYENMDLENRDHTIKIVCREPVIDIDRLSYKKREEEQECISTWNIKALAGIAQQYQMDQYIDNNAREQLGSALIRANRVLEEETVTREEIIKAQSALLEAMLEIRKIAVKEWIGLPGPNPEEVQTEKTSKEVLEKVVAYASQIQTDRLIPAVKTQLDNAYGEAARAAVLEEASQSQIDRAWAVLLNAIQYSGYERGDKSLLYALLKECDAVETDKYQNADTFLRLLRTAHQIYEDENAMEQEIRHCVEVMREAKDGLVRRKPAATVPDQPEAPGRVVHVNAREGVSYLKVSWKSTEHAKSYRVYICKNGKWTLTGETSKTSYKIKNLVSGTKYTVKITSVNSAGQGPYSAQVRTATSPKKVRLKYARRTGKQSVKLKWGSVKASGYEVWMKYGNHSYKRVAVCRKPTVVKKKWKRGRTYSVKIRAYVKNKNVTVYGAFSNVKKCRVR